MSFNFDRYKTQCLAVAKGFQNFRKSKDESAYQKVVNQAEMLTPKLISLIELQIIMKGGQFRPIDAYQF